MSDHPQDAAAAPPAAASAAPPRPPRTAVVVVHGMGSQRPVETLRGVAKALWTSNAAIAPDEKERTFWLKPAQDAKNFDVATITTLPIAPAGSDKKDRIFEFHEFYWADLLSDTRPVSVLYLLFELMRKGPKTEEGIKNIWWLVAFVTLLLMMATITLSLIALRHTFGAPESATGAMLVTLALSLALMRLFGGDIGLKVAVAGAILLAIFIAFLHVLRSPGGLALDWLPQLFLTPAAAWAAPASLVLVGLYLVADLLFLTPYFGDVARYVRNSPANVAGREAIRERGVQMLKNLTESGRYDRIIVVAHSLGSMIAYDVLRNAFARAVTRFNAAKIFETAEFKDVATGIAAHDAIVAQAMTGGARRTSPKVSATNAVDIDAWRKEWRPKVRALSRRAAGLRDRDGKPVWLVSDFVTMGSPLTHAAFLLPRGVGETLEAEFERRREERELPACPPLGGLHSQPMTYTDRIDHGERLHHGALFGFVRWTNLYFNAGRGLHCDFIGGPMAGPFGRGVVDRKLTNIVRSGSFAHTWYWEVVEDGENAPHLQAFRQATLLRDEDEARAASASP